LHGKNPSEALAGFVGSARRALLCITERLPQHQGAPPNETRALTIDGGAPFPVGGTELELTFTHHYRVVPTTPNGSLWRVTTDAYLYDLDDKQGTLCAYHWHPQAHGHPDPRPHLHMRMDDGGKRVRRLPCGRITIEELVRMLIEELGAKPRDDHWSDTLDGTKAEFDEVRTWGADPPPSR
jgi:hypothetical protein